MNRRSGDLARVRPPARGLRAGLLLAVLLGLACASSPVPKSSELPARGHAPRPDLPVDYDVLAGEMAELDGDITTAREAYAQAAQKHPDSAYLQRRQAELAGKQADIPAVARHAARAVQLEPEDIDTRIFLGRVHRTQGKLAEAYGILVDEDGQPLNLAAGLLLFQMFLERNDLPSALAMAEKVAAQSPDELASFLARATVYERMGEYRRAERTLREALESHPDQYLLYGRIARLRRASGDREGEIALYEEILELEPDDYGTLRSLGEAMIAEEDIDGAVKIYERIVEVYPEDLDALRRLTGLEYSRGHYAAAEDLLLRSLETHPEDAELLYALGQVRRGAGDTDGSREAFGQIPPAAELYVDSRLQIAMIEEEEGDYEAALVEIKRVRSHRSDRTLDFHAAALHARTGDLEGGLAILEAMHEPGAQEDPEVLYQIGVLYGAPPVRDTQKSIEIMLRVIELEPDHAQALNFVAYTWAERGENLDQAEAMIRRALRSRPHDGYIIDSLGWVFYMRARPLALAGRHGDAMPFLQQAQKELVRAAELTGGDPVVSEHLGDVYMLMDEKSKALHFYEEAVRQDYRPAEQPGLLEKLETLKQELGRP